MKLRTEITELDMSPIGEGINYGEPIFTIGSCFAQSIGAKMARAKLSVTINPTGTLYNPLSICDTIDRLCERRLVSMDELREGALGWYHYDMHSSLNGATAQETLDKINGAILSAAKALEASKWVIITLGTAWLYELLESSAVVANCHKEPSRNFLRRRAELSQIVERLHQTIERHLADKRVILTLSPIRHLADGLRENSLSKATLRLAIEEVVARDPERRLYLPAYEILVDDLRDYRFYADDMVHPSAVAVEYIWEYFARVALSERAQALLPKVLKIVRGVEHRPINPHSEAHKRFCEAQLRAMEELSEVDLTAEREDLTAIVSGQLKINS